VADTARPRVYVIQSHDTITSVAARYGLKPGVLLAANPNINPTRLRVGQSLNLP
jgi:LysM repeat protein